MGLSAAFQPVDVALGMVASPVDVGMVSGCGAPRSVHGVQGATGVLELSGVELRPCGEDGSLSGVEFGQGHLVEFVEVGLPAIDSGDNRLAWPTAGSRTDKPGTGAA
ncbi:hypothetical protein FTX61_19495 [Nitriliruptoraceae bacterium ZYF776]|nr:hypothetical protein [Profundirhabdus halotolerans]